MANHAVNIIVSAKDQASGKFRTMGQSFGSMIGSAARIGAAVGGVYGLSRAVTGSVKAFIESESAAKSLADALGTKNIEQYQKFAAEMQRVTTFEDDATIATMKLGVTIAKLSGDDLKAATQAAMGLSKAYNMDLEAAMTLVSKAAVGETGTFKRLGIVLKDGMTDQQKYQEVLRIGRDNFRIATGETETFGGMIKQMGNAWGDAKESLGQYIAESSRLKGVFQAVIFGLQNIGEVAKTSWAIATAAMNNYYDKQIERANKPGLWGSLKRAGVSGIGTVLGNTMAMVTSKEARNYMWENRGPGILKNAFRDWNYYRKAGNIPSAGGAESSESAGGMLAGLMQKWDDMGNGRFAFAPSSGGIGGGGGVSTGIRGGGSRGWSLHETRTGTGGRGQSKAEELLTKIERHLSNIETTDRKGEKQKSHGQETAELRLTNFRK